MPNYKVGLPPEGWIKSYELAMEMLDVHDVVCDMMLDGPGGTWLKSLPANSINSWAELKALLSKTFKGHASSLL